MPVFPHLKPLLSTLLLALVCLPEVLGQPRPVSRHFSVEAGLPSSEVNHIAQDSQGYIWFATDRGVSRFDGSDFHNFSTDDGLPDNSVARIFEDDNARIWFLSSSFALSFLDGDSIRAFQHNIALLSAIGNPILSSFHIDADGTIHLGFMYDGYTRILPNGKVEVFDHVGTEPGIYVKEFDNVPFHFGARHRQVKPQASPDPSFRFFPLREKDEFGRYFFRKRSDGTYVYAEDNRATLVYPQGDTSETPFTKRISGLFEDEQGSLWVSFYKGGVRRYVGNEIRPDSRAAMLEDLTVSHIFQDREGGLWMATQGDGVHFVPSTSFMTVNGLTDSYINIIAGNGSDKVFVGMRNGMVHTISNQGDVLDTIDATFGNKFSSAVSGLLYDPETGDLWMSTGSAIAVREGSNVRQLFYPDLLSVQRPVKSFNGTFWSQGRSGLYQFTKSEVVYRSSRDNRPVPVTAIYEDKNRTLWVGSRDGLYLFKARKFVDIRSQDPLLNAKVLDIAEDKEGAILVATSCSGLVVRTRQRVAAFTTEDGLASNIVNSVFVDEDNTYWLGTDRGLNSLRLVNGVLQVRNYTRQHGLVSNEVQQVFVQDGTVWVVTNKGATFFRPEEVPLNEVPPAIFINRIQINNRDTTLAPQFDLNYTQNFIRIEFIGLAYRNAGNIQYRLRLKGVQDDWDYTTRNAIQYTTLPSGEYEFELQASNEDGIWSETTAGFKFEIFPPFWQTWWFITLAIIVVAALVYGLVYYRIMQLKEQSRITSELNDFKHQALSAQMNPHFVFNCLNSIQNFIMQNDKKAATKYLSKFARLMRLTLDNSREIYVTLEDELKALDLYMELERLRFKNKFDYAINTTPDIDRSMLLVPSSLIQPYVENAIWHGILHKETGGRVDVNIRQSGSSLICVVQDDGIGREKAMEIKRQNRIKHKSAGMSITEKRLELINQVHKNDLNYHIKDLKTPTGEAAGTLVEFNLPIKYS